MKREEGWRDEDAACRLARKAGAGDRLWEKSGAPMVVPPVEPRSKVPDHIRAFNHKRAGGRRQADNGQMIKVRWRGGRAEELEVSSLSERLSKARPPLIHVVTAIDSHESGKTRVGVL
jgi:hypothetical protein